jgi:hypothetical protein
MARTKRWVSSPIADGISSFTLSSWEYFGSFLHKEMSDLKSYLYRGHRCDIWKLESTLDRLLRAKSMTAHKSLREQHLNRFRYATRGRRGSSPPNLENENDWWALGQHNGLATPLLDWTTSPFVAAFFAYAESREDDTKNRVVFAVHEQSINDKSNEIRKSIASSTPQTRPNVADFFRPMSNENPRLVSQGGLFSRCPDRVDLETWISVNFKGEKQHYILIKILLPSRDRTNALRTLNQMNINHLTLFPDLYGASRFSNTDLAIDNY